MPGVARQRGREFPPRRPRIGVRGTSPGAAKETVMFDSDYAFDSPTDSELLAIAGIDPAAVREVAEHDRDMRCPDRAAIRSLRPPAG